MTLRGGLQDLVEAIVRHLDPESLLAGTGVSQVVPQTEGYQLLLGNGSALNADSVVFASPAYCTADLIQAFDHNLAELLMSIRYVSTATVSLGYKRTDLSHALAGFGFVVPRSEKRQIIACWWSSTKFDHRAAEGYALVRAFIGGAHAEQLAESDNPELAEIARNESPAMMGISAQPVLTQVHRSHRGNPQYAVGHQERVMQISDRVRSHDRLYLVGSAYNGVGIPDCIEDGKRVAAQILRDDNT